jgi:hypothetical protein
MKLLKRLLIKKTCKENEQKKWGSNLIEKNPIRIKSKKNYHKQKNAIKRIRKKLERLKNHREVKLKIICNMIDCS